MHNRTQELRSVAQPGRALRSGRRGRGFEPRHSDHEIQTACKKWFFCCVLILTQSLNVKNKKVAKNTTVELLLLFLMNIIKLLYQL